MNDLICYCFGYSVDEIEKDYRDNGVSTIMEKIKMEKKFGNCQSAFNVKIAADRLESILNVKGMTIFKRIKHSESLIEEGLQKTQSYPRICRDFLRTLDPQEISADRDKKRSAQVKVTLILRTILSADVMAHKCSELNHNY